MNFSSPLQYTPTSSNLKFDLKSSSNQNILAETEFIISFSTQQSMVTVDCLITYTSSYVSLSSITITHRTTIPAFETVDEIYDPSKSILITDLPQELETIITTVQSQTVSKTASQTATQAATGGVVAMAGVSVAASGTGGSRLSSLIKVIDSVEFMLYLDGSRVPSADSFLHLFTMSPLAIIPNFVQTDERTVDCTVKRRFLAEGLSCSFLNNQGSELISLAVLILAFFITDLVHKLLTKHDSDSRKINGKTSAADNILKVCIMIIGALRKLFSFTVILSLFDGSQIELLRLSWVSILSKSSSVTTIIGRLISGTIILLYLSLSYFYFSYARNNLLQKLPIPISEELRTPSSKLQSQSAPEPKAKHSSNFALAIASSFEDYRLPNATTRNLHVYFPAISLLLNIVVQMLLVSLADTGMAQVVSIGCCFSMQLVMVLILRPFEKPWRNWLMIGSSSGFCVLCVLGVFLNILEENTIKSDLDKKLGVFMILLYTTIILLEVFPLLHGLTTQILTIVRKPKPISPQSINPMTSTILSSSLPASPKFMAKSPLSSKHRTLRISRVGNSEKTPMVSSTRVIKKFGLPGKE